MIYLENINSSFFYRFFAVEPIQLLHDLRSTNKTLDDYIGDERNISIGLSSNRFQYLITRKRHTDDLSETVVQRIRCIMEQNEYAIHAISKGKFKYGDHCIVNGLFKTYIKDDPLEMKDSHMFKIMQNVQGAICPKCGGAMNANDVVGHTSHPGCDLTAAHKAAEAKGYFHLQDARSALAVRKAGIDSMLVPHHMNIYVPKWVHDAVETYTKREASFADLSLEEYLQKMAGINVN